jgi:hypothetical protein
MRLFPGPLCGGELGTTGPQGSRHGCRLLFARTGVRSKSPAPTHELAGHACPASAKWGVVFSWVLLFWTSKREVPRPPKADESSCSEIKMIEQKHRAQSSPAVSIVLPRLGRRACPSLHSEHAPQVDYGHCAIRFVTTISATAAPQAHYALR